MGSRTGLASPKWFSAITCNIWLRLKFWRRGFARFFGAHLFGFRCPGSNLGPRIQDWARAGPGGFGIPQGEVLLWKDGFPTRGNGGGAKGEWILGAWRPLWAGPFPLNPPWKNGFTGISPFSQFSPGPWPGPVWALCGPYETLCGMLLRCGRAQRAVYTCCSPATNSSSHSTG